MAPAIKVENLSKLYRIGTRANHADSLRERLTHALAYPFRRWQANGAKSKELRAENQTEAQSQRQTAASQGVDGDGPSGPPPSALRLTPALRSPLSALRPIPALRRLLLALSPPPSALRLLPH